MPPPTLPNGLTPKQEDFCHAYLELGDATKAYRVAYKPKPNTKDTSVWRMAKAVLDNVKVSSRIKELRAPVVAAVGLTLESHLERLAELARKAEAEGQFSAAIQAEQYRGKAAGFYIDKKQIQADVLNRHTFTCIIDG